MTLTATLDVTQAKLLQPHFPAILIHLFHGFPTPVTPSTDMNSFKYYPIGERTLSTILPFGPFIKYGQRCQCPIKVTVIMK